MGSFPNDRPLGMRVMLEYLPPVLREVRDFQCLMGQYQAILEDIWRREGETEDNFYLETADERGLIHWENILGIVPGVDRSIEERRRVIAARLGQNMPYGWGAFLAFLTALIGSEEDYTVTLSVFTLTVRLRWVHWGRKDMVWELIRYMVPANLEVQLLLMHNTHGQLGGMTHREMGAYTHGQLKSEVERF